MATKEVTLILELVDARHGPDANRGEHWPVAGLHDHLADGGSLVAYLNYEGVVHPAGLPGDGHLQQIRTLADAGRSVVRDEPQEVMARIEEAIAPFAYRLRPEGGLVPAAAGWEAFAAEAAIGLVDLPSLRDRLRACANPECNWLFLDESRNNTRQWCSMDSCGSRAKMARYRSRQRTDGPP